MKKYIYVLYVSFLLILSYCGSGYTQNGSLFIVDYGDSAYELNYSSNFSGGTTEYYYGGGGRVDISGIEEALEILQERLNGSMTNTTILQNLLNELKNASDENLLGINKKLNELLATKEIHPLVMSSQPISVELYPRESMQILFRVRNTRDVTLRVEANITGSIIDFVTIENPVITLDPGKEEDFGIYVYIPKDADIGIYYGYILIKSHDQFASIPVNLRILEPKETLLDLQINPLKETLPSGEILQVEVIVFNPGESKELNLQLNLMDMETDKILIEKKDRFDVERYTSHIVELNISKNISEGKYVVMGTITYLSKDGEPRTITSRSYVTITKSIFESEIFGVPIWLFFAGFFILIGIYGAYVYHEREKAKKKRYLETIDFTTLPQPGAASGFIGRIAETGIRAFFELDRLQTHTLVAGATGSGKTVVAQVLAEEALSRRKSVLVFDPTAQWTGFLRRNKDKGMFKLYKHFHMKEKNATAFNGNIYIIKDPNDRVDVEKYIKPGEISVFCLNKLDPSMIDVFIENTIKDVFAANLEESPELKALFVYDEIHRLLPKFGGSGKGFTEVERAVREFRKWGIGLILISQVLSDFVGEIKANIGTEIQMRSRYEGDLERVKMKYGEDILKSVVKANIGTGMLQNAQYNKGRPYFVSFRPLLHNPRRLGDPELELYDKYNNRIDVLRKKLNKLKKAGVDVFDLELELDLTQSNIKKGGFDIVELYIESLEPKINSLYDKKTGG